ncbi:MAG: hypothetical protein JWL86_1882 [Rhizobium sp.]|nr:hypothetical protein [Rhizobium sp.]
MASISTSRRSFLLRTVGLGALAMAPALRGTSAAAFTLQDMPANSRAGLAYAKRCGDDGIHQK